MLFALLVAAAAAALALWLSSGEGTRIALERQGTAWVGQPVHIEAARATIFPRFGVSLRNVTVGAPVALSLGQVQLSTGLRALLGRRIEDAAVMIAGSRVQMPLPFEVPGAGAATSDREPIRVVSVRTIALRDVVLTGHGPEVRVSADSSLSGSILTLTNITATSGDTTLTARGRARLAPLLDVELTASAGRMDLDDLIAIVDAVAPRASRQTAADATPGRVIARVAADSLTVAGLTVPQFSTVARVQGNRISLSPLRFLLFGGRYEGDLDMSLRDTTSVTLTSQVRDIDVAQLAAFGGVPDTITGKLSGTGTFSGTGTDFAGVLASARGKGTATLVDGTLRRLNLARTVVLFFGRPAPNTEAASDAYERIDARFSLADQLFTAEALSLRSRDADIVGEGTLSLASKALDVRGDISLSEALSAQAGTDLYRYTREGNRIVLPATIRGTLGAPKLSIDAGAAVQRGLKNEVERRLKNLLDRFRQPG
jgi:hypothetical protein